MVRSWCIDPTSLKSKSEKDGSRWRMRHLTLCSYRLHYRAHSYSLRRSKRTSELSHYTVGYGRWRRSCWLGLHVTRGFDLHVATISLSCEMAGRKVGKKEKAGRCEIRHHHHPSPPRDQHLDTSRLEARGHAGHRPQSMVNAMTMRQAPAANNYNTLLLRNGILFTATILASLAFDCTFACLCVHHRIGHINPLEK